MADHEGNLRHVTVRLPEELFKQLSEAATRENRSISNMLRRITTEHFGAANEADNE
jgi:hypothetical protein